MATPSRPAPSSPAGWALWAGPCLSACRLAPWVTSPSLPQDKGHRNLRTALQLTPQNPPTAFASGHPHWPSPFSAPFPPTSPAGLAVPGSDRNLGTQPWVSALDLGLRTAGPAPALPGSSCELGRGTAGPQAPPPVLCCSHPGTRLGTHEGGRREREGGREPALLPLHESHWEQSIHSAAAGTPRARRQARPWTQSKEARPQRQGCDWAQSAGRVRVPGSAAGVSCLLASRG